jgi:DNA-binding beta-propeller fold protein YncE
MRRIYAFVIFAAAIVLLASVMSAQHAPADGPYKVLKTVKAGGEGGFDYISADVDARRLYIARSGPMGHLMVFNLDNLESVGGIPNIAAGGAVVDPKSHHGFSTTREKLTMWDSNTLKVLKTFDIGGRPDGIMFDPYNERVWVLSHTPPDATIVDAKEGTVIGTLALGGGPEQAVSDGKGKIYINISDKANIAVVDAKNMTVTAHYPVGPKHDRGSGLAFDAKNAILFAYFRQPSPAVIVMNANNGNIITTLPTGVDVDTVAFNPATMEAISAENGGTMTFIKENSPTNFVVEQTLQTKDGAKTLALDTKTNRIFTMTADFQAAASDAQPGGSGRPPRGPMVPGSFSVLMIGKK